MRLDKDGRLAISEAEVERTCVEWMHAQDPRVMYLRTDASDRRRNGAPSHARYTLDGVFTHPTRGPLFVEWKRRRAATKRDRREGQADTAARLADMEYQVIRMPDGHPDPIEFFKQEAYQWK